MSTWFSEYRVRCLAERIAPRIAPAVEAAITSAMLGAIRAELPGLLMDELRREIPELVPKRSPIAQRGRDDAIRAAWRPGVRTRDLAAQFRVSIRHVQRLIKPAPATN